MSIVMGRLAVFTRRHPVPRTKHPSVELGPLCRHERWLPAHRSERVFLDLELSVHVLGIIFYFQFFVGSTQKRGWVLYVAVVSCDRDEHT